MITEAEMAFIMVVCIGVVLICFTRRKMTVGAGVLMFLAGGAMLVVISSFPESPATYMVAASYKNPETHVLTRFHRSPIRKMEGDKIGPNTYQYGIFDEHPRPGDLATCVITKLEGDLVCEIAERNTGPIRAFD